MRRHLPRSPTYPTVRMKVGNNCRKPNQKLPTEHDCGRAASGRLLR